MSYKFTLDHTLALENVHDMVTINIKPDTRCIVTGEDIELCGHLIFDGSYLTKELGEEAFAGAIPLDITLPYLGGEPDVRLEVTSFDYLVDIGESLTLNLEIGLRGYEADQLLQMAATHTMSEQKSSHASAPVTEEAVIEPFDTTVQETELPECIEETCSELDNRAEVEVEEDITSPFYEGVTSPIEEAELSSELDERAEVEVEEDITSSLQEDMIPYSPLVEINRQEVDIEAIEIKKPEETALPVDIVSKQTEPSFDLINKEGSALEIVSELEKEEINLNQKEERGELQLTSGASALINELFARKSKRLEATSDPELVEATHDPELAEATSDPELAEAASESERVAAASESERLEVASDPELVEEIDQEHLEEEVDELIEAVDSVARQFADGESIIKMIYVRDETQTLGGVLERYSATLDDVWNLPELADGVSIGDCVMIKNDKLS